MNVGMGVGCFMYMICTLTKHAQITLGNVCFRSKGVKLIQLCVQLRQIVERDARVQVMIQVIPYIF